jgi:hypothetical protein
MTLPLHASVCRFVAQMQDCATQCIGGRCFLVPSRSDHRRWRVESNCDTNAAGIDAARDRGYRQNNADVMISATKLASIGNAERTTRALNERVVEHPLALHTTEGMESHFGANHHRARKDERRHEEPWKVAHVTDAIERALRPSPPRPPAASSAGRASTCPG